MFKKFILSIVLATSLAGCATLGKIVHQVCPTPVVCATSIITDFIGGVDAAGQQEWLSAADVSIADQAATVALDTVAASPNGWKSTVQTFLTTVQSSVSTPAKWEPYIASAEVILSLY